MIKEPAGRADVDCLRASRCSATPLPCHATAALLGRTARNSIISVLTQYESDFILDDSAPLKLAQYCRKQENILREKKYYPRRGEENEDGMPGANRANESRWQYASAFALSMTLPAESALAVNVNERRASYTLLPPAVVNSRVWNNFVTIPLCFVSGLRNISFSQKAIFQAAARRKACKVL